MKPLLILNRTSEPPKDGWYQIEVTGEHPAGGNRVQVIDKVALSSIVNRFRTEKADSGESWAGMLVDSDHLSHDEANTTEAMAWLQDVDIRNGQLWGKLDLTDLGEPAIRNKRYKFFSTEYAATDLQDLGHGRVRPLRLAGLAFTNRPNNRGGKPISNRNGTLPGGETKPNTETNTPTMKPIAEKLGLSAEATEADILAAITKLQTQCADLQNQCKTEEADKIMNRFGERIPEASRPHWKQQLILNREATEKLMDASFPAAAAESTRIHNRTGAKAPTPVEAAETKQRADEEKKAAAIRNRAHEISSKEHIPFNQAFPRAAAEMS